MGAGEQVEGRKAKAEISAGHPSSRLHAKAGEAGQPEGLHRGRKRLQARGL